MLTCRAEEEEYRSCVAHREPTVERALAANPFLPYQRNSRSPARSHASRVNGTLRALCRHRLKAFDRVGQKPLYTLASITKLIQHSPKLALLAFNPIGRKQHEEPI